MIPTSNRHTNVVQNNNPLLKDSVKTITQPITANPNPPKDTVASKPVAKLSLLIHFHASDPHYVVLVLNKVDPVF